MKKGSLARASPSEPLFAVAFIQGKWWPAGMHPLRVLRNPSKWKEKIGRVPLASKPEIAAAARAADAAQPDWAKASEKTRKKLLLDWASRLLSVRAELVASMALEIGKPVSLGEEEVMFCLRLLQETARSLEIDSSLTFPPASTFAVRRGPVRIVGLITPWNNPLAIPVGKLAPAIGYGNAVVWKPAVLAPRTASIILQTLQAAGCPDGLVNMISGEKEAARHLILSPEIQAISFTGSCKAGLAVAGLAARRLKPVQLELGGNNAALIMPDCDVEKAATELAASAFSFSGQRCTAPRRFIVHRAKQKVFKDVLTAAVLSLQLGPPSDPETWVGPLISRDKQHKMRDLVKSSLERGAKILCGGTIPESWKVGCWFQPTVVLSSASDLDVIQEESFGPVATLQVARDINHALELLNSVPQGLVASLYSKDPICQRLFLEKADCGVLKLNQTTLGVRPDAPFGGWKASGLGPFEHGHGDREFYTRIQTLYG
jgi:acyl-CoA reductase-like NAD-dependent aldehyde dehydrogenase